MLRCNQVLAMFFNMFFAVRESAELELSKFYNETDERAKELAHQQQMDAPKTQREMELGIENGFHHELPTETGIHELPNGAKILVVRRCKSSKSPPELMVPDGQGITSTGTGSDNESPNPSLNPSPNRSPNTMNTQSPPNITLQPFSPSSIASPTPADLHVEGGPTPENETDSAEMELVHIPIDNILRGMWEHIETSKWTDPVTKVVVDRVFLGQDATRHLVDRDIAVDTDDAVQILYRFMEEYSYFQRVDPGKMQQFEGGPDTHYQWTKEPEAVLKGDLYSSINSTDINDIHSEEQLAFDDIMIGYRESYGGYQRILKVC